MPTDKETMIEYEKELQGLLSAPRCAVSGCQNLDIEPRGPVWMQREDVDMAFEVCVPHWEAIISVVGTQAEDSPWTPSMQESEQFAERLRGMMVESSSTIDGGFRVTISTRGNSEDQPPPDVPRVMDDHDAENYDRGIKLLNELDD